MGKHWVNVQTGLVALHREFGQNGKGGWREVGLLLQVSGAYARQLALGERPITPRIARRYLALGLEPVKQKQKQRGHISVSLWLFEQMNQERDEKELTWDEYLTGLAWVDMGRKS